MGEAGTAGVSALLTGSVHFGHGTIATIVGIAPLVIGATAVLGELQRDLDRIWDSPALAGRERSACCDHRLAADPDGRVGRNVVYG